ncbi:hypothetical protein ACFL7M_09730 [Thermodesulfobacteriota bacterium]
MSWHRILLTSDQVKEGEIKELQKKFREVFHEAGLPNEMALFAGLPLNSGERPFYLTPVCLKYANDLISHYSGSPCEKPKRGGLEPSLVIGFNKAWDLLLD